MKKVNKKISAENTTKKNYFNLNFQRKFRNVTGGLLLALGVIGAGTSCQKEEDDPINFINSKPPVTNPNDTIIRTDQDTVPTGLRTIVYNFNDREHLLFDSVYTDAGYMYHPEFQGRGVSFLFDSLKDPTVGQIVLTPIDSTIYSGFSHAVLSNIATAYEMLIDHDKAQDKITCSGPLLLDTARNPMVNIDRFRNMGFNVTMYDIDAK